MIAWIGIGLVPYIEGDPVPARPPLDGTTSNSLMGPGRDKHLTKFLGGPLTQSHWNGLENGTMCFRVVGGATYRDAFGIDRETNFNLIYGGPHWLNEAGALTNESKGNDAT